MAKLDNVLTAERARFLFSYEPSTGALLWRNPTSHRVAVGDKVGVIAMNGRRYVGLDGHRLLAHRIAWLHFYGELPEDNIAPENGDYDDLRISNLVRQSFTETSLKNDMRNTNKSGYRGVMWDKEKGKWRAEITQNYKRVTLGRYDTLDEAVAAYEAASRGPSKPFDVEERRRQSEIKKRNGLMRSLWKRTIKANNGIVGWASFAEFVVSVQDDIRPYMDIASSDAFRIVGPDNFAWKKSAAIDYKEPSQVAAYLRQHRQANRDTYKNRELKKAFGITLDQFNEMLKAQNGVCAICGQPETDIRRGKLQHLSVDHCHATNVVRDLLCGSCNKGIGYFRDNPGMMRAAADYIERHKAKQNSVPASNVIQLKAKGALGS